MKFQHFVSNPLVLASLVVLAVFVGPGFLEGKDAAPIETLKNLQAAYEGESNAHARYLAFAEKADEEKQAVAASLFRAAARAEEIHAANHAVVIRKLGAEPSAEIQPADVKSTQENLAAAVKGESYERDVMYPEFIKKAKAEKQKDALRTFNYAISAEKEHARLYTETLASPVSSEPVRPYFVCTVCGYTTTSLDFSKCPSCMKSKDNYVQVS